MSGRLLRNALSSFIPNWLANRPGLNTGFKVLYSIALVADAMVEAGWEGLLAAFPGVGTATALPLIGSSRGLLQGPNETDAAFAARCVQWLTSWELAGSAQGLGQQIQAYLVQPNGTYPVVVVVDRAGNVVTCNADQSVSFSTATWTWDNVGGWVEAAYFSPGTVASWWSDLWVIVQDFSTHYTSFTDPNWLAAWNSGDQTLDGLIPQSTVQGVMSIVDVWKGAHSWVREVIFTPNPASFLSTPNGLWGNASHNVSGTQTMQRVDSNAYWTPVGGG